MFSRDENEWNQRSILRSAPLVMQRVISSEAFPYFVDNIFISSEPSFYMNIYFKRTKRTDEIKRRLSILFRLLRNGTRRILSICNECLSQFQARSFRLRNIFRPAARSTICSE